MFYNFRYGQEAGYDPRYDRRGHQHQQQESSTRIENYAHAQEEEVEEGKKQSFWKRFTLKGRSSKR